MIKKYFCLSFVVCISFSLLLTSVGNAAKLSDRKDLYLGEVQDSHSFSSYQSKYDNEIAKIFYLIDLIKETEHLYIRNRREYSSTHAATFLSLKYQAHKKKASTALEFVNNLASESSTTGRPYYVVFDERNKALLGDVLTAELEKLEDYVSKKTIENP